MEKIEFYQMIRGHRKISKILIYSWTFFNGHRILAKQ